MEQMFASRPTETPSPMTQYSRDGNLGTAAVRLTRHSQGNIAQLLRLGQLFHESYQVSAGAGRWVLRYRAVLMLPVDVFDEWRPEYEGPALEAFNLAATGEGTELTGLRVAPLPEAEGWRERLASLSDWGDDTPGWWPINEKLDQLKGVYRRAVTPEDFKDVGRRARDLVIAAVDKVYRPTMLPAGQDPPKGAKAKFGLILDARAGGARNADMRKALNAVFDQAQALTHTGDDRAVDAFAVAQATIAVVRTLAKVDEELHG
jgi:hypothetical protein